LRVHGDSGNLKLTQPQKNLNAKTGSQQRQGVPLAPKLCPGIGSKHLQPIPTWQTQAMGRAQILQGKR
jgi:hypothetical protein